MGMFSRSHKTFIQVIFLFLVTIGVSHAEETMGKFNDPTEKSLEAGSVSLVQSENGRVVEVRVQDCELCNRTSYLPHHNLEVKFAGEEISQENFVSYSGKPGAIVFNTKDYMVTGVYYWKPRVVEDEL